MLGEPQLRPQDCTARCYSPAVTPGPTSDAVGWLSSITRLVALNQCSHLDAFLCLSLA